MPDAAEDGCYSPLPFLLYVLHAHLDADGLNGCWMRSISKALTTPLIIVDRKRYLRWATSTLTATHCAADEGGLMLDDRQEPWSLLTLLEQ